MASLLYFWGLVPWSDIPSVLCALHTGGVHISIVCRCVYVASVGAGVCEVLGSRYGRLWYGIVSYGGAYMSIPHHCTIS